MDIEGVFIDVKGRGSLICYVRVDPISRNDVEWYNRPKLITKL